jgi:glycine C-acetyltransferase
LSPAILLISKINNFIRVIYSLFIGLYVIAFSYPVVPKGQARIRVQLSAAHSLDEVKHAIESFTQVGRELGVIS